mgnify:CR=1 FL=1
MEKEHLIFTNPCEHIITPVLGKRLPINVITERDIQDLMRTPDIDTILGFRDRTILELFYSTGIRRAECFNLKVNDVDYKGGYLRVNLGKGQKDRVIPIGKTACFYLKEYLLRIRPAFKTENKSLFLTNDGQSLSKQSIEVIVKKYAKRAGILKQVTPHTLRRSFATHMLKNGAHPMYIQKILGHQSLDVLNKYIEIAGVDLKATHHKTHPREKDHD